MAHIVTCVYCKEKFNRDKEPFYQVSKRRYAHPECQKEFDKNKTQEEKDLETLEKYIMFLFKEEYITPRIRKQLNIYKQEYDYTYSGIFKALKWWFEVKGNSVEKANGGIGIVPYIYNDAKMYYYSLFIAQCANQGKDIKQYIPKARKINIPPPTIERQERKLFDINTEGWT